MKKHVRQREIWYERLNPVEGSERSGRRPVVIVSGDTMNDILPIAITCSLSSKIKGYPGCVVIHAGKTTGLEQDSEAITFQIRTLAHTRLVKKIGAVSVEEFHAILQGLQEVLTL